MYNNKQWTIVVIIAAIALTGWLIAGCGGGEAGPATGVSGRTVDVSSQIGIGGLTVTVGGQQDVTDDNGNFTVTGVPTGLQEVTVVPTELWVQWYDAFVTVEQDQITPLGDPILVMNPNSGPPPIPHIPGP